MGERLKWLREYLKENQDIFRLRMKVSKPTYIKYENNKASPRCDELFSLVSSVNNLNLFWIITGDGHPFEKNIIEDYKSRLEKLEERFEQFQDKTVKPKAGSE